MSTTKTPRETKWQIWVGLPLICTLLSLAATVLFAAFWKTDHSTFTVPGNSSSTAVLQAQLNEQKDANDRELQILGVATAIVTLAGAAVIGINLVGVISSNLSFSREKESLRRETELSTRELIEAERPFHLDKLRDVEKKISDAQAKTFEEIQREWTERVDDMSDKFRLVLSGLQQQLSTQMEIVRKHYSENLETDNAVRSTLAGSLRMLGKGFVAQRETVFALEAYLSALQILAGKEGLGIHRQILVVEIDQMVDQQSEQIREDSDARNTLRKIVEAMKTSELDELAVAQRIIRKSSDWS